ncbi:hypothetical protein DVH24_035401 [Malus domestica]|uniref:C-CAP/cofactor C-like domain-containing protein n=1 Tax=Malus domestica TaxID=3750 RepID=A0A498J7I3_MALDO|nr:hypothetical protein DVH24_035401 [Malus domestica]
MHAVGSLRHVKILWFGDMDKMMHHRKENSQPGGPVFPNLEMLHVRKCIALSPTKSLQQVKKLEVECCEKMVEIVPITGEDDSEIEISFGQLQHVQLSGLLQVFCSGNCIVKVPSLDTLIVNNCQIKLHCHI